MSTGLTCGFAPACGRGVLHRLDDTVDEEISEGLRDLSPREAAAAFVRGEKPLGREVGEKLERFQRDVAPIDPKGPMP